MKSLNPITIHTCFFLVCVFSLLSCANNSQNETAEGKGSVSDTALQRAKAELKGDVKTINNVLSAVYMTGDEFIVLSEQTAKLSFQFCTDQGSDNLTLAVYKLRGNDYLKPPLICTLEIDKWTLTLNSGQNNVLGGQKLQQPDIGRIEAIVKRPPGNPADKIVVFWPIDIIDKHVRYGLNVFESLQQFKNPALAPPQPLAFLNPSPPASDN